MADWARPLFRTAGASAIWHAPRIKSYTTVTYCEEKIEGPLEIASEDRAEREGRCTTCATLLTPPMPLARAVTTAVVKKGAAEEPVSRPRPKKKSPKVTAAKRTIRGSRRGRA